LKRVFHGCKRSVHIRKLNRKRRGTRKRETHSHLLTEKSKNFTGKNANEGFVVALKPYSEEEEEEEEEEEAMKAMREICMMDKCAIANQKTRRRGEGEGGLDEVNIRL
jgi:hypothetical protein